MYNTQNNSLKYCNKKEIKKYICTYIYLKNKMK